MKTLSGTKRAQAFEYPVGMTHFFKAAPRQAMNLWWATPLILLLCATVFWPGFSADWGRDDYMQLAMARLVGSPWPFFIIDHFPLPNSVFRPLGFASFWLGQAVAGSNFQTHAAFSLALFASIALLFHALLLRFGIKPLAALAATLFLALHPVTVGTALWWSARFDILAVLFVLLALHQVQMTIMTNKSRHLAGTLLALLAAALSKEIGLIGAAAAFLLFQHWAWTRKQSFWAAQRACLLCISVVVVFLAWRSAVLGTGGSGIVAGTGLFESLIEGMQRWFELAPIYFAFQPQLAWSSTLLMLVVVFFAGALVPLHGAGTNSDSQRRPGVGLALTGLSLALLPALLQAPVVRLNALPLTAEISAVEAAMQSRLYFMSLTGLGLLLALLFDRVLRSRGRLQALSLLLGCSVLIASLAVGSHQQARSFADVSARNAELARRAMAVARGVDWPETAPCHLVLEGITPPPEWSVYVSMDSVIKALHPDLEAIDHCFIHANYPTFYHLIGSEHGNANSAPFQAPVYSNGPLARRQIGGLTFAYLQGADALTEDERAALQRRSIAAGDPATHR